MPSPSLSIYRPGEGDGTTIQIGPFPDPGQLRAVAFYLLTFLAMAASAVGKIMNAPGPVLARLDAYAHEVDEWRERTDRDEHARLTALGFDLPPLAQDPH